MPLKVKTYINAIGVLQCGHDSQCCDVAEPAVPRRLSSRPHSPAVATEAGAGEGQQGKQRD